MRPLEADEPTAVGPYRLLGRLGSGGMGRVYLGRSAGGRTVAVKIVHPHFALRGGNASPDDGDGEQPAAPPHHRPHRLPRHLGGPGHLPRRDFHPLGTFRVTVHQAAPGERVGTPRHTDIFGGVCDDVLT